MILNLKFTKEHEIMNETSKRILICDDEEGIRESLRLVLGDHYNLLITDTAEQCLEMLDNQEDIGLVMLDIKMPKVSGLELLEQIKEKHPEQKVIMVTGYKSVETAAEASKLGACGYVVKPFESKELLETVHKNLSSL